MNRLRSHRLSAVLSAPETVLYAGQQALLDLAVAAVGRAGLTALSSTGADFSPHGASVVVLLQESHVALHAWPEHGKMTVDIHVCDFNRDNLGRARLLAEALSFSETFPANRALWNVQTMNG